MKLFGIFIPFACVFVVFARNANQTNLTQLLTDDEHVFRKWIQSDEQLKKLSATGVKMAMPFIMEITSKANVSSKCLGQSFRLISDLRKLKPWAITFLDASGKMIDGLFSGTHSNFGNYDECLDAVAPKGKQGKEEVAFQGKYCIVELRTPLPKKKKRSGLDESIEELTNAVKNASELTRFIASKIHLMYGNSVNLGICIPSGCSLEDIDQLVQALGEQLYLHINAAHCEVKEEYEFTKGRIFIIFFFSLAGLLVIVGSFIELYSQKKQVAFKSKGTRILLSFSIITNFQKLMDTKTNDLTLSSFNGLRSLTLFWVILEHAYLADAVTANLHSSALYYIELVRQFLTQIITSGVISVDVFFFIGGFLNSYMRLKERDHKNKRSNIVQIIIHRFWRIYPGYIAAIMFLFILPGSGPLYYKLHESDKEVCRTHWWTNLIFINNFYFHNGGCLSHSWYVACDFQLFLVSLITVPLLWKMPKLGVAVNSLMIFASIFFCGIWTWVKDFPPGPVINEPDFGSYQMLRKMQFNPLVHAAPYFIGILGGYLYSLKKEYKVPYIVQVIGWCLSIFFSTIILFSTVKWNRGTPANFLETIFYASTHRAVFTLGIAWVAFCCVAGYGGIVNYILSLKLWIPIARLSFLTYMVSPILQMYYMGSLRTVLSTGHLPTVWRYMGDVLISCLVALIFCLLIEAPFISLEKVLLFNRRSNENGKSVNRDKNLEVTVITHNGTNHMLSSHSET